MISNTDLNLDCEICQKRFLTPGNKKEHIKRIHNKEKKLCCEYCSKIAPQTAHVKCIHETKELSCEFCDNVFAQETLKKRHLKTHTNERPFQCQTCGYWLNQRLDMTKHRSKHSEFRDVQWCWVYQTVSVKGQSVEPYL